MGTPKRAAIFDLDGTLIHSLPDLTQAINKLLADHHRSLLTESQVMPMIGDGAITLIERAFAATGGLQDADPRILLQGFLDHYEPHATDLTRPFPGVIETLRRLHDHGILLAVCTNKPSAATDDILCKLGLHDFFQVVVGSDATPAIKPDPQHVHQVLDRLGVTPDEAVMVGDSINDLLAAKGARVTCILVSFGYARTPVKSMGAALVIDHFEELIHALIGHD